MSQPMAPTGQHPPIRRLTTRRRSVLYLRAAGRSYDQIAAYLGISEKMVRKDLIAINKTLLPGLTDGPEPAKGYRLIYALGLLDAGVDPKEIRDHMEVLALRADWLRNLPGAQAVATANLADVAEGSSM
jgi:biotin operon repressor